jgi:hypothetical protein
MRVALIGQTLGLMYFNECKYLITILFIVSGKLYNLGDVATRGSERYEESWFCYFNWTLCSFTWNCSSVDVVNAKRNKLRTYCTQNNYSYIM